MSLVDLRERAFVHLVRWLPKRLFSRVVGLCARVTVPRRWRRPLYETFARRVGADLSEAEKPLEEYASLDAFFVRRLKPGARPIVADPDVVVSPCDGMVSEHGTVEAGRLIQAKGHDYRLVELLADEEAAARFAGGTYLTIYLAPRNYHRVHFAVDGRVTGFQHIAGDFYPVNPSFVRGVPGLFSRNERLVIYQESPFGDVATVMVAATGVGNISVTFADVETNRLGRGRPGPRVRLETPRAVRRGDELGAFHLGSTVILLFEAGRVILETLTPGQAIRLGQAIARRASLRSVQPNQRPNEGNVAA